jgi:hypothetical protein
MMMEKGFTLETDHLQLPTGAWARAQRRMLRRDGKPVLALTQGRQRAYVYPLFTPAGFAVTSESPADHPHHNSIWIAADHVHCRMPVADGRYEEYTYNFYVDEVFQGRAPGRLVETGSRLEELGADRCRIVQDVEWRGPVEWAAPLGRLAAVEQRILDLGVEDGCHTIDVHSRLEAREFAFSLGPTRHAYFNVRVAESMTVANGGTVRDDAGRSGGEALTGTTAKWISYEGPVGGGHRAGIAVFPHPHDHDDLSWFVTDWGVVTVGPFRINGRVVRLGEALTARYRVVVFDGAMTGEEIQRKFAAYVG